MSQDVVVEEVGDLKDVLGKAKVGASHTHQLLPVPEPDGLSGEELQDGQQPGEVIHLLLAVRVGLPLLEGLGELLAPRVELVGL